MYDDYIEIKGHKFKIIKKERKETKMNGEERETFKTECVVEVAGEKNGKYFIKDKLDQWYSTFKASIGKPILELEQGDRAEVTYFKNKGFQNILHVEKIIRDDMEEHTEPSDSDGGAPEGGSPPILQDPRTRRDIDMIVMNQSDKAAMLVCAGLRAGLYVNMDDAIEAFVALTHTNVNKFFGIE